MRKATGLFVVFVLIASIVLSACGSPSGDSTTSVSHAVLNYVPADASILVSIRPQRLNSDPQLKELFKESITSGGAMEQFGLGAGMPDINAFL